jgi:hypothetical protein
MAEFRIIEKDEVSGKIKAHHVYTVNDLEKAVETKPYFKAFFVGWLRRQVAKRVIQIINGLVK